MQSDDFVCRSIIFPKGFNYHVLDQEAFVKFDEHGGNYSISVASEFLLANDNGVHRYGCRVATTGNARLLEKHGFPPEPLETALHYLGYYRLRYRDVVGIKTDYYSLTIRWRPENGETAHFEVLLNQTSSATKKQLKQDRLAARGFLSAKLDGPDRYICECDIDVSEALLAIDLPVLRGASVSTAADAQVATSTPQQIHQPLTTATRRA